jgi:hypothetical protein
MSFEAHGITTETDETFWMFKRLELTGKAVGLVASRMAPECKTRGAFIGLTSRPRSSCAGLQLDFANRADPPYRVPLELTL